MSNATARSKCILCLWTVLALAACLRTAAPEGPLAQPSPTLPPAPPSPPSPPPTSGLEFTLPTPTSSPEGGRLVEGGLGELATLDPLLADEAVMGLIFEGLLAVDPQDGAPIPNLARSWRVSDDGLTVTFELRDDVLWHDGEPFTAADARFTFQAVLDLGMKSPRRFALASVEDFEALGAHTFVVKLSEPGCSALYDLGLLPIVAHHLGRAAIVGTGPFMLEEWVPGDHVTLVRNPRYWRGAPRLEAWTYRAFPDEEALLAALEEGEVDVAPIRPQDVRRIEGTGRFEVLRYPAAEYYFIAFNNDHPILGDGRVRRALSLTLDRRRLLEEVLAGQGTLLGVGLLPGHWASRADVRPPDYDSARARQLLAQAGWADSDGDGFLDREGEPLRLSLSTNLGNEVREAIAVLVGQYYRAVGVAAQVELVEWGNLLGRLFEHRFDAAVLSWPLKLDPDQRLLWHSTEDTPGSGFNFVSYHNSLADALLEEGAVVPGCDRRRRAEVYGRLWAILARDRPYDFLFAPDELIAVNRRLVGPAPSPFAGPYWNANEWYMAPSP